MADIGEAILAGTKGLVVGAGMQQTAERTEEIQKRTILDRERFQYRKDCRI